MKNILCALGLLLISFTLATAQTEKGTKSIGGGIGFDANNQKDFNNQNIENNEVNFSLFSSTEYFILNNLSIKTALGLDYNRKKIKDENFSNHGSLNKNTGLSISIFTRKYIPIVDKKLFLFVEGGVGYSYIIYRNSLDVYDIINNEYVWSKLKSKSTGNTYNIGAYSGLAYFISPKLEIESTLLQMYYSHNDGNGSYSNSLTSDKTNNNTLGLGLVSGLNLSLKYYFK